MFFRARSTHRPFHYGPFPLEALPRDDAVAASERAAPRRRAPARPADAARLAEIAHRYRQIFLRFADGEAARCWAALPDDLERRAADIKGAAYFMDAAQVGICRIPPNARLEGVADTAASHAVVFLVEHGRVPEADNPAHAWVAPEVRAVAEMRAAARRAGGTRGTPRRADPQSVHRAVHDRGDCDPLCACHRSPPARRRPQGRGAAVPVGH